MKNISASLAADLENPFGFFDAIYCININQSTERWQSASGQFQKAGLAAQVRRFPAVDTPLNHHVGCALSHRAIIQEAGRLGLKNVLVFEDDVMLTRDALPHLQIAVREVNAREWDLLYLGACRWEHTFPMAEGCTRLEQAGPVTCLHAVAYNESVYQRILSEVPADVPAMEGWLSHHCGIDQYFASTIKEKKFLVAPVVATTPALLPFETEDVRRRVS